MDRAGEDRARGGRVAGGFVLILFALGASLLAGGGLGIAGVVTLGGLGALVVAVRRRRFTHPDGVGLLALAMLGWAALSFSWSPYDNPEYLIRLIIGSPLYVGFFLLCVHMQEPSRRLAREGVVLCTTGAAAFFAFELATSGAITASYRDPSVDMAQIWRNLGHGLSAWIVMLPAALVILLQARAPSGEAEGEGRKARSMLATSIAFAFALVLVGAACAIGYGLTSNLAGLIGAGVAALAAWRVPRTSLAVLGGLVALALICAPLLGALSEYTPAWARTLMPDSWELRLEAWRYAADRIAEKPVFGWGFDASRTMDDTIDYKGAAVVVMPLHPHNAGLQLWLETGLVGVSLTAALALALGREAARARHLTHAQAIAAAATAAAYGVMAQVSYGVWQEWWLATIALGAASAALAGPAGADAEPHA